ncbi:hypothetical protein [Zhongshania borealis]|uniref:Uncharacterized protein n=1 Tax=Zhongshania borealis TaxID=889488 RepID=A0ABP7X6K0_9GAMM|tara:strand:- start:219 stop:563 length:345 start_codon:yes stop_codon:yes gene_type:complete
MKPLVFAAALSAAVYGSAVSADCFDRVLITLKSAPEIPSALESNFETMEQVGEQIQGVVSSAESLLSQCSGSSYNFRFSYVMHRIESIANDYNEQARLYNSLTPIAKDQLASAS